MSKLEPSLVAPGKFFGISYGYIIVIVCFLIMTVAFGAQNSFGVFFKPMSNDFGWSRAATSGPFALYMVVNGLLSIISGRLSDRFGPKLMVSIGGIILGTGYILMSRITGLWQLYLFYGILVSAGSSSLYVPLVSLIARWFTNRRGLMSGIGIAGIGFGIGIVPAIASQLMVAFEWRVPLLMVGIFCMASIVMLAQMLKSKPVSNAVTVNSHTREPGNPIRETGFSFHSVVRTRQFWMIFIAWIFYGYFFQIGVVHIVPYATDLGMSVVAAATILSTIGMIGTLGRISLGFIGDKFGNRKTVYVSFGLMAAAYGGLSFFHNVGMLYLFAVVYGFLFGIGILLIPMIAEYFGFKELGIISGTIVFANNLGGAVGPPVAGGVFDATGSYQVAFISCGIIGLAACIIIWMLKPARTTR